jgi:2-oxoisovalerate dehydrogenase E1 component
MSVEELRARLPWETSDKRKDLVEAGLEDHVYRAIAELFGKEDGYCKGRGGGMHIADFRVGHLGANAIVGGGVPIATGAAMSARYFRNGKVTCCFAGDGAYNNGVVMESLNWAAMGQFTDPDYAGEHGFGLPIVYALINNHYGMTGRADREVTGIDFMARRAAGFADNNLNAEVVNGMDILACLDAMRRAAEKCRKGEGPVLIEFDTYRYYGHSLSDPRTEYRTKDEEAAWRALDPLVTFEKQLLEAGAITARKLAALKERVADRNARAAARAAAAADPDPRDVIKYMYTDTTAEVVPEAAAKTELLGEFPAIKRGDNNELTYKDAIKEALIEEMQRDNRVVLYGEDIAEYGGAFKVTKGLIEAFGRQRVFNSPISEAAICGTAVGASMTGLRPVVELMYMDFALMASDQIANQAGKWHYMSGATVEVPLVIRASVGGGKGYGGQHSQTLESVFAHIPGLYVVYPATPADAKGMLKTAIRDNNPILFVESQLLYNMKGVVPEGEHLIPLGVADVKRAGNDVTIVTWGPGHARLPQGRRDAGRRGVTRPRSLTCARWCRSTWRPSSPPSARRDAAWWPARPSTSAASPARSPRASWPRPSTTSTPPCCASAPRTASRRSPTCLKRHSCPTPATSSPPARRFSNGSDNHFPETGTDDGGRRHRQVGEERG